MTDSTPLPTPEWIETTTDDDLIHLEFRRSSLGENDGTSIRDHVKDLLDQTAASQSVRLVIFDLQHVELITSAVLGSMIVIHRHLAGSSQQLVLTRLSPDLAASFDFMKLDDVFTICRTEEALDQLIQGD